jgi:hypothetical protein
MQLCAHDAPALSAQAELEASFANELKQLESEVDSLQRYKLFMQSSLVQHDLRVRSLDELVRGLNRAVGATITEQTFACAPSPAPSARTGLGALSSTRADLRGVARWQGFARLLAHASEGNVAAMGALGHCFLVGCGTRRNCAEGVR